MIKITRLFEDFFDDPAISIGELLRGAKDHIDRLKALNLPGQPLAGQFTAMIATTEPKYDAYEEMVSGKVGAKATRVGATFTKDEAMKNFKKAVSDNEGLIRAKFSKASAAYLEFFPEGVSQYSTATMENVLSLMDNMVSKCDKYQAELGTDVLTKFTELRAAYVAAQDAQGLKKGGEEGAIEARNTARKALTMQMTANAHDLGKRHTGAPERANDYFTQSIFEEPKKKKEEIPPV